LILFETYHSKRFAKIIEIRRKDYCDIGQATVDITWLRYALERDSKLTVVAGLDSEFEPIREREEFVSLLAEFKDKL
jgi:hypothetical protein